MVLTGFELNTELWNIRVFDYWIELTQNCFFFQAMICRRFRIYYKTFVLLISKTIIHPIQWSNLYLFQTLTQCMFCSKLNEFYSKKNCFNNNRYFKLGQNAVWFRHPSKNSVLIGRSLSTPHVNALLQRVGHSVMYS